MDALKKNFPWRHPGVRVEVQHTEALLGPVPDTVGGGHPRPTARMAQLLRLRQIDLVLAQLLFRLFPVVDIDVASVPGENASGAVKQRECALQDPAVFSIEPPEARNYIERFPLRYRCHPLAFYLLKIIGVIGGFPTPPQPFPRCHSRVFPPTFVKKIHPTVWSRRPEHSGDGIDD